MKRYSYQHNLRLYVDKVVKRLRLESVRVDPAGGAWGLKRVMREESLISSRRRRRDGAQNTFNPHDESHCIYPVP